MLLASNTFTICPQENLAIEHVKLFEGVTQTMEIIYCIKYLDFHSTTCNFLFAESANYGSQTTWCLFEAVW